MVMTTVLMPPARPVGRRAVRSSPPARRPRVALSSMVYLPAFSIPVVAAVLVGVGWSSGWGGAAFAGSLTSLRLAVVGPLAVAIIGFILVVERIWPAQQRPFFARGYRHDLLITVVHATLVLPLVTSLTLSFAEAVRRLLPWVVLPRMDTVPRWIAIVVIIVAMDGCNWAVHLANHRVRMLWRFHELHHSQEDMNVLTVFRTHPLIHVSYLLALLPGLVLLANGALSVTVLALYGGIVAFAHSNTRLGFGPLGRIFVSPNFHRIHHKLDGPQDVNLGFALTIWDQLFRTAVFPTAETVRTDTGLPGRPLLVEQATPHSRHLMVYAAQLVAPFRPLRAAQLTTSPSAPDPLFHAGLDRPSPDDGRGSALDSPDTLEPCGVD
jgi:sterol desaturase/sphingolipid hydroxylase (fatty acid hydroxylase superfamily)